MHDEDDRLKESCKGPLGCNSQQAQWQLRLVPGVPSLLESLQQTGPVHLAHGLCLAGIAFDPPVPITAHL